MPVSRTLPALGLKRTKLVPSRLSLWWSELPYPAHTSQAPLSLRFSELRHVLNTLSLLFFSLLTVTDPQSLLYFPILSSGNRSFVYQRYLWCFKLHCFHDYCSALTGALRMPLLSSTELSEGATGFFFHNRSPICNNHYFPLAFTIATVTSHPRGSLPRYVALLYWPVHCACLLRALRPSPFSITANSSFLFCCLFPCCTCSPSIDR